MSFIQDLVGFFLTRKKYWMFPIIFMLLLVGLMLVLSSGSALAPFVYTLF